MALNAGMYRGRIGDRAYFGGLGNLGTVYAGSGPYGPSNRYPGIQVAGPRLGATRMVQVRDYRDGALPAGIQLSGVYLGARPPSALQYVQLPDGRFMLSR